VGYALGRGAHLHLLKVRLQQQVQREEHIFIVIYDEYRSVFHTAKIIIISIRRMCEIALFSCEYAQITQGFKDAISHATNVLTVWHAF
jgi:hypothetical protein